MVHAIQAAYHWSDEQVLDIRLARLVQIVDVLNVSDSIRKLELEWQSKLVASVVAATIEDEKGRDQLLKHIDLMNLRGLSEEQMAAQGRTADTSGDRRGDGRSTEDVLANGSVHQALARNLRRKGPGILGMS